MNAGTSTNQYQKRIGRIVAVSALLVGLWVAAPMSQTGQVMPPPKFTAYDANGDPCAGCKLFSYVSGTTTKQDTYTSATLGTPNANPVILDSAGRATVFLDSTDSYKFVLAPATDTDPPTAAYWTVDNVVGPFSGVVSITAASTRGLQISRSSAEAGLSIASSGGSGKTYGIVSNTSGALLIRDDADGTPNIAISGNDVTTTATGTVITAGNHSVTGTLAATGATTLGSTLTVTGAATFNSAVTAGAGLGTTSTAPQITFIESDGSVDNKRWDLVVTSEGLYLRTINDAVSATATAWSIQRTGTTVDSFDLTATATTNTGRYNSATAQPGFLAYNSTLDGVATGGTVDFDTEVYDDGGNFAADTFTAPVTGRYQLCTTVTWSDNSSSSFGLRIVTTARTYQVGFASGAASAGVTSGCVYADMAASATASVQVLTGDVDIDIEGGSSPLVTYFSGRLVP
jgi:hypothetical protein